MLYRYAMVAVAALAAGCGTTRTFVDYSRGSLYSTETAGNVPYVEVGPVTASQRGFFWEPCWQMAEDAVAELQAEAVRRGANNVVAVQWLNHSDGTYTETPVCTTGWGWFTAAFVGGFAPWVKATEVKGRLVNADEASLARLRGDVQKRSAAWQAREAVIVAEMEACKCDRAAAEALIADREAARVAAEKAAVEKAAAEKLAAEKAAAAAAERLAAEKAAAAPKAKPARTRAPKAAAATTPAPAAAGTPKGASNR